ncbi:MAG: serine/threonine-protein kinase [Sphingomonadales bacterium]|jgi:serine/threonine-protein kinase
MSTSDTPDDETPSVPPAAPAPGAERTVIASAEALAAALGGSAPPPPAADPFAASMPPAVDSAAPPLSFVASGPGAADALVGVQLNDLFEVVRFIAEGGMGRVYEGRNIASGERVAIKVILGQYAADEQFMALFRREASSLEKIGHDALVKYRALAYDRSKNINYLAIEYVDGPSMAHVLTGQSADPAQVKRVLRRLAQGLHTAHELGVIHRDLSPDNVLLPGGNIERAKIIDFGIAKDNNPGEKSVVGDSFAGKFGYAAPEVFGKYGRKIGAWTDIYSLGLVIIALARGTPQEMGITIVDALEARESVPDISDLSPDLQPIIARMLAPDPADRFQTMEEVADACDPRGATQFLAPAAAAPAAPAFVKADAAPAAAAPPARKLPIPAIAAVAVVVLAGAGWLAFGSGSKPAATPAAGEAAAAPDAGTDAGAVASAADWATSAPQLFAALKAMPCSDVHVDGVPQGGRVRLTGWRAESAPLPPSIAGWQIDGSAVSAVSAPNPATCRIVDSLRAAAAANPDGALAMPGLQRVALSSLPRNGDGTVSLDLKVANRPGGALLLTSIDDATTNNDNRVVSGDLAENAIDVSAIPYEAKPSRYLLVLVSSPGKLPSATPAGADSGMAPACRGGACQLTSGWIEVR